jgi:hypothetical protein
MKDFVHDEDFHRITSRHIARCLSQLEEINMPGIVIETIKRELWYLSNDLKKLVMKENVN